MTGLRNISPSLEKVDASNYGLYMKPQDVERQKVLESYGYRFLRLNRFNLGKDPVRTLDERISRMAQEALQAAKPHAFVEKVKEQTNGLANGEMRQCSVCGEVKSIDDFRDMKLARGYGRKCQNCKTTDAGGGGVEEPVRRDRSPLGRRDRSSLQIFTLTGMNQLARGTRGHLDDPFKTAR